MKNNMISFRLTDTQVQQLLYLTNKYKVQKSDLIRHLISMKFKDEFILDNLCKKDNHNSNK